MLKNNQSACPVPPRVPIEQAPPVISLVMTAGLADSSSLMSALVGASTASLVTSPERSVVSSATDVTMPLVLPKPGIVRGLNGASVAVASSWVSTSTCEVAVVVDDMFGSWSSDVLTASEVFEVREVSDVTTSLELAGAGSAPVSESPASAVADVTTSLDVAWLGVGAALLAPLSVAFPGQSGTTVKLQRLLRHSPV